MESIKFEYNFGKLFSFYILAKWCGCICGCGGQGEGEWGNTKWGRHEDTLGVSEHYQVTIAW